jgi:predicted ATPase
MESIAPSGSVAVSEATAELCEGYFELRGLGPTTVKGVSTPVTVYEVLGPGPLRTHFELSTRRGLTRFVGRGRELEQMRRALEQSMAGHGQIVAVVAEAGTGKSRVFYEFKATIPTECKILEAHSVSHGKASAWLPVIELLRAYFGLLDADDAALRREKIRAAVLDATLAEVLPYLWNLLSIPEEPDPLAQMDAQIKRQRTLEALKRILLRESLKQPVVIIFEDLHWIDSETQALLDLMADSIANARALMLVNYRPEYRHEWGNKSYYSQLRLEALDRIAASEMLTTLLGDNPELDALKRQIIERAEGNPFFIEEILQVLFDEDVLARNGVVRIARPFTQLRLPPTVQGILAARIDRQPPENKQLLQTLAVIGRESKLDLIKQIVATAEPLLHRILAGLQASEFIYEQPTFPQTQYVFKHALTQEVAYNSMLVEQRKALHERAGQALESMFLDQLDHHVGELARHYSGSDNTGKAVEYLYRAGQQAAQRSAHTEAIDHLTNALGLLQSLLDTPERTRQELALYTLLGPVLMEAKGYAAPEVARVCDRARVLSEQTRDAPELAVVLRILTSFYVTTGELQLAHEFAGQMLSLSQGQRDGAFLPHGHYSLAMTSYFLGDLISAHEHAEQAIELYDPEHNFVSPLTEDPKMASLGFSAWTLWLLGYPDQSIQRMRQALTLTEELPRPYDCAFAELFAAWLHHFRREARVAQEHSEAVLALSNEHGFPFWLSWGTIVQGWALSEHGQREEGIERILEGINAHRATGAKTGESWGYAVLAEAYENAGRVEEGLDALSEALAVMNSTGEGFYEAEVHRLKAELLVKQDASEARICVQRAIDVARKQSAKSLELRATRSLARLLAKQGRRDEARAMLAEIYNWFTEGFGTADLKDAKALLDELSNPP